jgi:hypothetical protein
MGTKRKRKEKKRKEKKRKENSPGQIERKKSTASPSPSPPSLSPPLLSWMDWTLHANPHDTNHNVHPLALAALVLVAPHAVPLVVPVRARGAVHAPAAHLRRRPLHSTLLLLLDLPSLGAIVRFGAAAVQIRQMLDDGRVHREFVSSFVGVLFLRFEAVGRRRGFGDQGLQDCVDYGVVPGGGLVVLVGCGGGEGGVAGAGGDFCEAGGGDGLGGC